MQNLGLLGTLGKQLASARVGVKPKVVEVSVQTVELPVAEPVVVAEPFLSVSESVEVAPQSTSPVEEAPEEAPEEVTAEPSEEQCASTPAPASTASSHTEESS